MDCTICLDEKIHVDKMKKLDCGHAMCIECYDKLIRNLCPFCRHVISLKHDDNYNIDYSDMITDEYIYDIYESDNQIDNVLPQSELTNYYYDDEYSTYYPNYSEDYVLRKLNKRKCKKNKNKNLTNNFRSNKDRGPLERKSKKNKKRRSYH